MSSWATASTVFWGYSIARYNYKSQVTYFGHVKWSGVVLCVVLRPGIYGSTLREFMTIVLSHIDIGRSLNFSLKLTFNPRHTEASVQGLQGPPPSVNLSHFHYNVL